MEAVALLLDLPEDALLAILAACPASALGSLATCCHQLRVLTSDDSIWARRLQQDYDVPPGQGLSLAAEMGRAVGGAVKSTLQERYRAISGAAIKDLRVVGFLTDGGLDPISEVAVPAVEEKEVRQWDLPEWNPSWVGHAFEPDERCFSSDVAPDRGAASNVTLVGRITGNVSAGEHERRRATAERRDFLLQRLCAIPGFMPAPHSFGGVATMDATSVDNVFMDVYEHPNGVAVLVLDLGGRERDAAVQRLREYSQAVSAERAYRQNERLVVTRQRGRVLVAERFLWEDAQASDRGGGSWSGLSHVSSARMQMRDDEVASAPAHDSSGTSTDDPLLCPCDQPYVALAAVTDLTLRRALNCSCPAQVRRAASAANRHATAATSPAATPPPPRHRPPRHRRNATTPTPPPRPPQVGFILGCRHVTAM